MSRGCSPRAGYVPGIALGVLVSCTGDVWIELLPRPTEELPSASADGGPGPEPEPAAGGLVRLDARELEALRSSACVSWKADSEPEPAALMLIIDTSGSMSLPDPSSTVGATKWEATRSALEQAITPLPRSLELGILYYPGVEGTPSNVPRDASACVAVDAMIPPATLGDAGSAQRARIQTSLDAIEPRGGTPTHDAYLVALAELRRAALPGREYLVLITDGQPTYSEGCVGSGRVDDPVDESPIIEEVRAAHATGIRTFVIGSPGSEETPHGALDARPWLSRAAEAGGTAPPECQNEGPAYCHFDMVEHPDFGEGLRRTLEEIADRVIECDFPLPEPPPGRRLDTDQTHVVYTSSDGASFLVLESPSSPCQHGWHYDSDGQRLQLCPETCDLVQADGGGVLELLFRCRE
jgi:hypothetical protein